MALGTTPTNNLECFKGEDFTPTFVVGADLAATILGWTIVLTVKDDDNNPTFTKTVNATITDAANRLFQVAIPAATSATIPVGTHKYDIWRTDSGTAWVLSVGDFKLKSERRVQTP